MNYVSIIAVAACVFAVNMCAAPAFPGVSQLPSSPDAPDPLVMLDGRRVTTPQQWFDERRPELWNLFQHYMYGWFPPPERVNGTVTRTDAHFFGGKATLKLVTLEFGPPGTPRIHLMMVVPNRRDGPAPVFLGMNFSGNHTLVADTNVPVTDSWMPPQTPHATDNHALPSGRGTQIHTWELEQSIDRGYAVATYYYCDVEPDNNNPVGGVRETIHTGGASDNWGIIAAWAWGMQRAVDYLVTDKDIDGRHIALVGHSRLGKASLLAAAFDERVALVIPLQSGCGGTAPSRGKVGESVEQINTRFPLWFCGEFKKFNTQPDRLPFDQNSLIALCAPRPVLLGAAVEDTWANPAGAFDMLKSAGPAYRLLGAAGLAAETMPETNKLIDSNLGFFIRPGQHAMTKTDWDNFLDFADKQWGKIKNEE